MLIAQTPPSLNIDPAENPLSDGNRVAEYMRWRAFADGNQWATRAANTRETRLVINYARALPTKVASYTFAGPLKFELPKPEGVAVSAEETAAAERALAEIQRALSLDALDLQLEIERSIIGDAAIKVTWDAVTRQPRVISVDPAALSVLWAADDPQRALQVAHTYTMPGHALHQYIREDPLLQDGVQYTVTETWSDTSWQMDINGLSQRQEGANPYGWIPYLVLPNNPHPRRFWGRSDLIDLVDIVQEYNRELSVLSTIMQQSGSPIAVLENVDGSDNLSAKPGAKWELPEGAKAYLLDLLAGGGVRLHVDYVSELRTSLHDLSETPRTAFGDTGRALSGAALEVEIQPLVQRVRRKRSGWERFHRDRNMRLLDLMDRWGPQNVGGLRITRTIWPDVLPSDEDSAVRNQVALVTANIRSRSKAAEGLGETDTAAEWLQILAEQTQLSGTEPDPVAPNDGTQTDTPTGDASQKSTANEVAK